LGHPSVVAAYLVTGKKSALVDMGYQSSTEIVLRDLEGRSIDYLLPTHVHLDHSGACGALAKKFPNAAILVHPIGQKHLIDPSLLIQGATELFGTDLMTQYGLPEPIDSKRVQVASDDDQIDLGDGIVLRTVWTPGHASHHLSYFIESTRTMLTGDCVGVHFPEVPILAPTTPPTSFNLDKALLSLERVEKLNPEYLCTPHFGPLRNPQTWLEANKRILREWEARVADSLKTGKPVELIAKELTDDISMNLHRLPGDLPAHFKTLVRVDVIGMVRWLQYASERKP